MFAWGFVRSNVLVASLVRAGLKLEISMTCNCNKYSVIDPAAIRDEVKQFANLYGLADERAGAIIALDDSEIGRVLFDELNDSFYNELEDLKSRTVRALAEDV